MADLELLVNGKSYAGWKSARVTRSIETVSGSFELTVSERWADQPALWPILEEDECTLKLGGTTVLTGYVDKRRLSYGAEDHVLSVSGRDKTGDLVDCSVRLSKVWEFFNTSVLTVSKKVAAPLGIKVTQQAGLTFHVPLKITIDPGDSAHDVIERTCRLAGALPVSDGNGGLLLTQAGTQRCSTSLVEGQNILSASADFEASGRFHDYRVMGQHKATDEDFGLEACGVVGTAVDSGVRRTKRVLVVRPEADVTPGQAKRRAQWEATVRAARGDTVTVDVQGWAQANGELWPVNARVDIKSPLLGVDGEMLITQAVYSLDDSSGTTTQLTLRRPDAFKPQPIVEDSSRWKELRKGV